MDKRQQVSQREKEFFDREYEQSNRNRIERFHAANEPMHDLFIEQLLVLGAGKEVLELGCGRDPFAKMLVENGARVTAVDISSKAIEIAKTTNKVLHSENLRYLEMNIENLEFSDNQFDFVFGSGILHHVDVQKTLIEISRVTRPGGVVLFVEPLGMNPVITLYRRLSRSLRTQDEHPFTLLEIKLFRSSFVNTKIVHYSLTAPIAMLLPQKLQPLLLSIGWKLDRVLFKIPFLRYWSWVALFYGEVQKQQRDNR